MDIVSIGKAWDDKEVRAADKRRTLLKHHSVRALAYPNKAKALREILTWAARLVENELNPASTMMGDLKAVIIGEGFTDLTGRGEGRHYVGGHVLLKHRQQRGSEGFLPHYSDESFQVHHVVAALVLGRIPFAKYYAIFSERAEIHKELNPEEIEWWDIYVYQDFCPIGAETNDRNFRSLPDRVYSKLTGIQQQIGQKKQREQAASKPHLQPPPPVEYLTGVRERLKRLGFYSGPINGPFDPVTKSAVQSFQRAHPPLLRDGIPGPKTQARLKQVYGS